MKFLTIVRHAKSSWSEAGVSDHDRPLNARGNATAPAVGRFLARTYFGAGDAERLMIPPEQIVSSTATRAMNTAELLASQLSIPASNVRLTSKLYLAERQMLLSVVRDLEDEISHALIVAHNPGLHEFCNLLLSRSSIPKMPTCAVVMLSLPHQHWGMTDWEEAQLIGYVTPKALERRFPSEFAGMGPAEDDD